MNSQEYWRRRQIEREKKWHDLTTTELKKLAKYYRQSSAEIERDIAALFGKFARENRLPIEEARRLIRGEEFKTWRMTLQEYVRKSQVDPKILRELNTLAMRSRINRLEALHARTLMELANLAEKLQLTADEQFARAYLDNYYRNLYDFHTTTGLFTPPNAVDAKRVESVLQTAWSGKNYSSRIWTNTRKLSAELQRTMLNAIHRGSSIQKLSKDLATRMDVAYHNAERLVRTELNAVENRASADAMREAGFDSYQFMATLDRLTCARCGERDGEIFALKDMNQGENAPPLHPRCRCTIVASLGGIDGGKKIAIDSDGKRIRIPSDMNYRDWKAIYIDKTKALAEWQIEFEARLKADEQSPLRQRGRAIIEQLANKSLPLPKVNANIGAEFDIQRFGTYEDQVRSHGGSGNIKPDKIVEGHERTPRYAEPFSIIDHKNHTGQVDKRIFYGEDGQPYFEINTTNHNQPKWHPFGSHGEHAHDITWDEEKSARTSRELTEAERKDNGDIL